VPMVLAISPIALLTVWVSATIGVYAWIWALAVALPLVFALRAITAIDDQRLLQVVLLLGALTAQRSVYIFRPRVYLPFEFGSRAQ
jgi:type IV secretory pathway VirB3-like protein